MPFTLHPLTPPDIPPSVEIYFTAFRNPHSLACWPRTPAVRAWWENMLRAELGEPGAHWLKALDVVSGELAGFVKWVRHPEGEAVDQDLPGWPEGADGRLCGETFGVWAREHARLMGRRGHWCEFANHYLAFSLR